MKMFINKTNIKLLAAALLTALAAPSCMNLDETREGGYGYLTISGLDLDVQVEQLVPTKAEPVTLKSLGVNAAPVEANATFTLVKDGKSQTVQPNTELELKAGTYTLDIIYDNNGADGFGEALFGNASYTVTITAGQNTPLSYSLPLTNSLVAVSVSSELKKDFTPSAISIAYGEDDAATVSENAYFFVPASSNVTATVKGTTAGVAKELEHSFTSPAAAKYADVKFGKSAEIPSITLGDVSGGAFEGGLYFSAAEPNNISSAHTVEYKYKLKDASSWTTATVSDVSGYKYFSGLANDETYLLMACVGNIESEPVEFIPVSLMSCVDVTAAEGYPQHYTENNELAGTRMQASVTVNLPSIVAQLATLSVESGNFKNGSDQRGTFKVTDDNKTLTNATAKSIEITNSADWPYFPKGDGYVLDATVKCVLPNNRVITSDPVSSTAAISSPAPNDLFTVTASANTTYSYYKDSSKGATEANKKTAENVFDITSSVTISDKILSNDSYKDLLPSVTYSVGGKSTSGTYEKSKKHSMGTTEITGLAWGSHSLTAKVTFDSAEVTSDSYPCVITGLPYDLSKLPQVDKWTLSGGEAEWSNNYIHLDHATENSATLIFSVIESVNVSLKTSFSIYTPTRFGSPSLTISAGGKDISTTTGASGTAKTTNYDNVTCSGTISSSNPTVKFNRTYFAGREGEVYIKALLITYRE
jgi:hypothetical protein